MQITTAVFDKEQRKLISELIRGVLPGSVPVAGYSIKVQEELEKTGILIDRSTIHQRMWWASNNQELFRAAFIILQKERPDQLKQLFNGTKFNEVVTEKVSGASFFESIASADAVVNP